MVASCIDDTGWGDLPIANNDWRQPATAPRKQSAPTWGVQSQHISSSSDDSSQDKKKSRSGFVATRRKHAKPDRVKGTAKETANEETSSSDDEPGHHRRKRATPPTIQKGPVKSRNLFKPLKTALSTSDSDASAPVYNLPRKYKGSRDEDGTIYIKRPRRPPTFVVSDGKGRVVVINAASIAADDRAAAGIPIKDVTASESDDSEAIPAKALTKAGVSKSTKKGKKEKKSLAEGQDRRSKKTEKTKSETKRSQRQSRKKARDSSSSDTDSDDSTSSDSESSDSESSDPEQGKRVRKANRGSNRGKSRGSKTVAGSVSKADSRHGNRHAKELKSSRKKKENPQSWENAAEGPHTSKHGNWDAEQADPPQARQDSIEPWHDTSQDGRTPAHHSPGKASLSKPAARSSGNKKSERKSDKSRRYPSRQSPPMEDEKDWTLSSPYPGKPDGLLPALSLLSQSHVSLPSRHSATRQSISSLTKEISRASLQLSVQENQARSNVESSHGNVKSNSKEQKSLTDKQGSHQKQHSEAHEEDTWGDHEKETCQVEILDRAVARREKPSIVSILKKVASAKLTSHASKQSELRHAAVVPETSKEQSKQSKIVSNTPRSSAKMEHELQEHVSGRMIPNKPLTMPQGGSPRRTETRSLRRGRSRSPAAASINHQASHLVALRGRGSSNDVRVRDDASEGLGNRLVYGEDIAILKIPNARQPSTRDHFSVTQYEIIRSKPSPPPPEEMWDPGTPDLHPLDSATQVSYHPSSSAGGNSGSAKDYHSQRHDGHDRASTARGSNYRSAVAETLSSWQADVPRCGERSKSYRIKSTRACRPHGSAASPAPSLGFRDEAGEHRTSEASERSSSYARPLFTDPWTQRDDRSFTSIRSASRAELPHDDASAHSPRQLRRARLSPAPARTLSEPQSSADFPSAWPPAAERRHQSGRSLASDRPRSHSHSPYGSTSSSSRPAAALGSPRSDSLAAGVLGRSPPDAAPPSAAWSAAPRHASPAGAREISFRHVQPWNIVRGGEEGAGGPEGGRKERSGEGW